MRTIAVLIAILGVPAAAWAGCELSTGPCSTDAHGNTYRTHETLGGGYRTERNGQSYSSTNETLGGAWREKFNDGSVRSHNSDPYSGYQGRRIYTDD